MAGLVCLRVRGQDCTETPFRCGHAPFFRNPEAVKHAFASSIGFVEPDLAAHYKKLIRSSQFTGPANEASIGNQIGIRLNQPGLRQRRNLLGKSPHVFTVWREFGKRAGGHIQTSKCLQKFMFECVKVQPEKPDVRVMLNEVVTGSIMTARYHENLFIHLSEYVESCRRERRVRFWEYESWRCPSAAITHHR